MRFSKSWIIAAKDFKSYRRKKNILYAMAVVPFLIAFLIPGVIDFAMQRNANRVAPAELVLLLPAFLFFYVILAAYLATPISSYTIVGEKMERSLEPLLATPTTDDEILFGKAIAAFLPPLVTLLAGSTVFMLVMDLVARSRLGYYYFPDLNSAIVLFMLLPLALLMSVEVNVIVSSRVTDVRSGQQLGTLTLLPFAGLYVAGELNLVNLGDTNNLLIIAGALLVLDVLLFFLSRATFKREEILTKWR